MRTASLILCLCLPAAMALPVSAEPYPTRPIRILVGYSPAGAGDFIARIVGEAMARELGQPVTIDNRPGAGSTLASNLLAQAPADGYTLGLATGTLYGIDQQLYKVRYTPASFTPVSRLTVSPLILAVNKDIGVADLKQLVAKAQANPGKLNYSSSGIGGSPHIAALSFEKAVGAKMAHIPYKGGAPALQAVVAGDVQLSFGTAASVLPLGQQGTVHMLGVTTANPVRHRAGSADPRGHRSARIRLHVLVRPLRPRQDAQGRPGEVVRSRQPRAGRSAGARQAAGDGQRGRALEVARRIQRVGDRERQGCARSHRAGGREGRVSERPHPTGQLTAPAQARVRPS